MMDSLAYRNDAAIVLRRLIRSLPTRRGVLGVATCDKGLPAMMMALAALRDLPVRARARAASRCRPPRARTRARCSRSARASPTASSRWRRRPSWAAAPAPRPAAAASSSAPRPRRQVVGEALGLSLPHSALAPSGQPIWLDMARRSARALRRSPRAGCTIARHPHRRRAPQRHDGARGVRRLDQPAAAPPGDRPRRRPAPPDRATTGSPSTGSVPRLVDVLPNGPRNHPDRARLPGRRRARGDAAPARAWACSTRRCLTVTGEPLGRALDWWEALRAAHARCARGCRRADGVDPDDVIMDPERARERGLTSTVDLPARQPGPGGLGDQEHRHRSARGRRRRRLPQDRPGARLHQRDAPPSPPSRARGPSASSPATCSC